MKSTPEVEAGITNDVGPPRDIFDPGSINWEEAADQAGYVWADLPKHVVELIGKAHSTVEASTSCEEMMLAAFNRRRFRFNAIKAEAYIEAKCVELRAAAAKQNRSRFTVFTQAISLAVISSVAGSLSTYAIMNWPTFIG